MSKSKKYLSHVLRDNLALLQGYAHNTLEGKLLTLVDAIFFDPEQRKAVKDNIRVIVGAHRESQRQDLNRVCADVYTALEKKNATESDVESAPWFVRDARDKASCEVQGYIQINDNIDLTR